MSVASEFARACAGVCASPLVVSGAAGEFLGSVVRAATFRSGYNTTVVTLGVAMLGVASGIVGCFAYLRRRSLVADALSHATLPGLCVAFLMAQALGGDGRSLGVLLAGAAVSGVLGVVLIQWIVASTRLHEDAAIGAILSVFFGVGVVLLGVVQATGSGDQGGVQSFIFGLSATMSVGEAMTTACVAAGVAIVTALMFRRFSLVSFNDEFAAAVGVRVWAADLLMLGLVVVVTIFGLQSVGIVLVVALMIVPPVTARLWTDRLGRMVVISACVGGVSGFLGAVLSASVDRLATGPVIVLCAGGMFVFSLLCAPRRGVLAGAVRGVRLRARIRSDHLLLAMRELEGSGSEGGYVARGVRDVVGLLRLARRGLARRVEGAGWRLTEAGLAAGELAARQRRLWEMYLVTYADVAPSHLDVAVDRIEHVLDPVTLAALEVAISAAQDAAVGVSGGLGGLDGSGRGVDA